MNIPEKLYISPFHIFLFKSASVPNNLSGDVDKKGRTNHIVNNLASLSLNGSSGTCREKNKKMLKTIFPKTDLTIILEIIMVDKIRLLNI
jgi:hypothetical protein